MPLVGGLRTTRAQIELPQHAVQLSFENWAGVTAEEKKMAKFFSGKSGDGSTFKVFALLPLLTTQKVGVEWAGGSGEATLSREIRMALGIMKATLKEDIQLKQEESAPGAGVPLIIR